MCSRRETAQHLAVHLPTLTEDEVGQQAIKDSRQKDYDGGGEKFEESVDHFISIGVFLR